ncbi:pyruvate kinase, partial [Butyricimonas virosa]
MKKTKIVATISDKRCEVEFLEKLYCAGMNVVRLNTAHQDMEQALKVVENVRKVSDNIAILIDTKGPEVRTMLMDEPMHVDRGETV